MRRLSPLLTADSLHQIELIQAVADPDTTKLRRARHAVRAGDVSPARTL